MSNGPIRPLPSHGMDFSVLRPFEGKVLPTELERIEFIDSLPRDDPRFLTAQKVQKQFNIAPNLDSALAQSMAADMVFSRERLGGFTYKEYIWYDFFHKTIAERIEFMPVYKIMTFYNPINRSHKMHLSLRRKNLTYEKLKPFYKRDVIFLSKETASEQEFIHFATEHPRFIIKPNEGASGRGVHIVETKDAANLSELYRTLLEEAPAVCEELIQPHPEIAKLYPDCVNVVRVYAFSDGTECHMMFTRIKVGSGGAIVDNAGAGGMFVVVDPDTGILTTNAVSENGGNFEFHPDTKVCFKGFQIPEWDAFKQTIISITNYFSDSPYIVAWDFALSAERGWQLVEGNSHGQAFVHQIATKTGLYPELRHELRRLDIGYSRQAPEKPFTPDYSFEAHRGQLQQMMETCEISSPARPSDRAPLSPLFEIAEPRFQRCLDGVFRNILKPNFSSRARLMFTGDIMCRKGQQEAALEEHQVFDFHNAFQHIAPILKSADLVIGNLETIISESCLFTCERNLLKDKTLNRNTPSTFLDALRLAGFDGVVTANNHCLDGGLTGLYQTLCHLDQYGLMHTGTFFDAADKKENEIIHIEVNRMRIALLSFTDKTNNHAKMMKSRSSSAFLSRYNKKALQASVNRAKEEGAQLVFCYQHMGTEHMHTQNDRQLRYAKELADMGIDLIIGSHPHVIQPFDYVTASDGRRVPIAYSLGNFLSNQENIIDNKDTYILQVDISRKDKITKIDALSYIPCRTTDVGLYKHCVVPLSEKKVQEDDALRLAHERISSAIGPLLPERKF